MVRTAADVHLLDVGDEPYGDCLVLRLSDGADDRWVIVDGGHRSDYSSIVTQLTDIVGRPPPFPFDLLIVSHGHDDHIGALPELVLRGDITAMHALVPDSEMTFGKAVDAAAMIPDVQRVVAVLREEPLTDAMSQAQTSSMVADAVSLRTRFDNMVDHLAKSGTKVVPFGSGEAAALEDLENAFTGVGFTILGPSQPALGRTSELLFDAIDALASDAMTLLNDGADDAQMLATLDAHQRLGNLVNAQSVVCLFEVQTGADPRRILLGGDYQFAKLGSKDAVLADERSRLVKAIADHAPYAFAKLSHHGSDNAVDDELLDALGESGILGICCGRGDPSHPDPETLDLLEQRKDALTWIRTDRSGHLRVTISDSRTTVTPRNAKNIDTPNDADAAATALEPASPTELPSGETTSPISTQPKKQEAMQFDIPDRASAVTIRVDLNPTTPPPPAPGGPDVPTAGPYIAPSTQAPSKFKSFRNKFQIGGGRPLGRLLFLTDSRILSDHIGANVVQTIFEAIADSGYDLCDVTRSGGATTVNAVAGLLHRNIAAKTPTQVVILGGYDVIPAQQVDAIPAETPAAARNALRAKDADGFIVWSDDVYVDIDGAGLADIPISRVPDGHDAMFTLNVLQADPLEYPARSGIRNAARPFVESIFNDLPGTATMLVSAPVQAAQLRSGDVAGSWEYFMLHGDYRDATRFWGEDGNGGTIEGMRLDKVPTSGVDLAVMGCCWGALPASTRAVDWTPGSPIAGRLPAQSIAFALLGAGARGVMGCTGAHYSPVAPPYNSASGPLHSALWERLHAGRPPAAALLEAKYEYAHYVAGLTDAVQLAVAYKTLNQFTCLGLGC